MLNLLEAQAIQINTTSSINICWHIEFVKNLNTKYIFHTKHT